MKRFAVIATVLAILALPAAASAHEQRAVGAFTLNVGWTNEPAYANVMNGVHVGVSRGGQPSTGIKPGEIKVDVTFGNEKVTLDVEPAFVIGRFGTPGDYRAPLIPTRAGTYVFRVFGSHDGIKVDATFTCGEQTFNCIEDPKAIQFPAKDPSAAELSERLDREFPRVETKVASVGDAAGSKADSARMMGIIGIVLGAIALVVSLVRGRAARGATRT